MDQSSIPCIFCGRPRDPAEDICPHCRRGWLDSRVSPPPPPDDEGDDVPETTSGEADQGALFVIPMAIGSTEDAAPGTDAAGATPDESGAVAGTEDGGGDAVDGDDGSVESGDATTPPPPAVATSDIETGGDTAEDAADSGTGSEAHDDPSASVAVAAAVAATALTSTEPPASGPDTPAAEPETTASATEPPTESEAPAAEPEAPDGDPETTAVDDEPPTTGPDAPDGDPETTAVDGEQAGDAPATPVADSDSAGRKRRDRLILGGIVLAIIAGWFLVLALISREADEPVIAGGTTTSQPAGGTSAPATTQPEAATTVPGTTSPAEATTTPPGTPIEPIGEPIPAAELSLSSVALGPLDFGSTEALGRLVASFDQPDALTDVGEDRGLCAGDAGFTATWGPLEAIFTGDTTASQLVGYRVGPDVDGHPANGLTTLSGARVGDSVADLEATYSAFRVAYQQVEDALNFILVRPSDGVTLLWGPVTNSDPDGVVSGIFSPNTCDGGPSEGG